jgi:hypothetical protein
VVKNIKPFIVLLFSLSLFAMEAPIDSKPISELYTNFMSKLLMLQNQERLIGIVNFDRYSPVELVVLAVDNDEQPKYLVMHVLDAYRYYVKKKFNRQMYFALTPMQRKIILLSKKYYDEILYKIHQEELQDTRVFGERRRPSTDELNKQIPKLIELKYIFEQFLNNNGHVEKPEFLTLSKWMNFECTDHFFSKIACTKKPYSKNEKIPGEWFFRLSASFSDDEQGLNRCRTIVFVPPIESDHVAAIRVIQVFGRGFFVAQKLEDREDWHCFYSLISLLRSYKQQGLDLRLFYKPELIEHSLDRLE